jgi:pimeloyl-ACP methyl ester carboxylesterase
MDALQDFLVKSARRLGTAGKILFPIPNRRIAKRLYRQTAETLLVWGREDRFVPAVYAEKWHELLPSSRIALVEGAGHMAPYEQPRAVAEAIAKFLSA